MQDPADAAPDRKEAAQRIVTAAGRLFAEHGYEGVSIRDIAAAAGISKANVFHHFANKNELHAAVMQCCAEPLRQLLSGFTQRPGSTEQVLAETLHEHLAHMLEHPDPIRLLLRQLLVEHAAKDQGSTEQQMAENFALAIASIGDMQAQGRLAADVDPAVLAAVSFGAHLTYFLCRDVFSGLPGTAGTPAGYDRGLLRILLRGILPDKSDQP